MMTPKVPDNWLEICVAEMKRGDLTSHPRKFAFAKENGMTSLDDVHNWMLKARADFVQMVKDAS